MEWMTGIEPALYGFAIRCVTVPPHPQFLAQVDRIELPSSVLETDVLPLHHTHIFFIGGEGGIRTHGGVSPSLVFKTRSLNRSDTSPKNWSGRQGSNLRRTAWKADTLPLSYARIKFYIL